MRRDLINKFDGFRIKRNSSHYIRIEIAFNIEHIYGNASKYKKSVSKIRPAPGSVHPPHPFSISALKGTMREFEGSQDIDAHKYDAAKRQNTTPTFILPFIPVRFSKFVRDLHCSLCDLSLLVLVRLMKGV